MIVKGIRVMCAAGCHREATHEIRCPGGGLFYCDGCHHRPKGTKQ